MVKDWEDLQVLGLVEVLLEPEEIGIPGPISAEKVDLGDILRVNKDDYYEYKMSSRVRRRLKPKRKTQNQGNKEVQNV